jgi:hypothetical protein
MGDLAKMQPQLQSWGAAAQTRFESLPSTTGGGIKSMIMTDAGRKAALRVVRAKGVVWLSIEESHWQQGMASLAGRKFAIALGAPWAANLCDDSASDPLWHEPWGYRRTELVVIGHDMDHDDMTGALEACLVTDEEMVIYMQNYRGAEPLGVRDETKTVSALLALVDMGDVHAVIRLLATDDGLASINARDSDGLTALHLACLDGRVDIASALVNAGASLDVLSDPVRAGEPGKTALEIARDMGNTDVADVIIAARKG